MGHDMRITSQFHFHHLIAIGVECSKTSHLSFTRVTVFTSAQKTINIHVLKESQ